MTKPDGRRAFLPAPPQRVTNLTGDWQPHPAPPPRRAQLPRRMVRRRGMVTGPVRRKDRPRAHPTVDLEIMMTDYIEVHSTTDSRAEADKICAAVINARLAACAQVS